MRMRGCPCVNVPLLQVTVSHLVTELHFYRAMLAWYCRHVSVCVTYLSVTRWYSVETDERIYVSFGMEVPLDLSYIAL